MDRLRIIKGSHLNIGVFPFVLLWVYIFFKWARAPEPNYPYTHTDGTKTKHHTNPIRFIVHKI